MAGAGAGVEVTQIQQIVADRIEAFNKLPPAVQKMVNQKALEDYGQPDYVKWQRGIANNPAAEAAGAGAGASEFATPIYGLGWLREVKVYITAALKKDFAFSGAAGKPPEFTAADQQSLQEWCAEFDFDDMDD